MNNRTVAQLLRDIAHADVAHGVYRVRVSAAAHLDGFDALIEMRGNAMDGYGGFNFHAETPELALEGVERQLLSWLGRCQECGGYRSGKAT